MRTTALHLTLGLLALFTPIAAHAQSGMPADCPLHAQHLKQAAEAAAPTAATPAAITTAEKSSDPARHAGHSEHAGHAAPAGHAGHAGTTPTASPYVDIADRDIAALSEEEIAALRSGAGHGFALPAELNRYPGPRHLLDMAADLGLDAGDTRELQAIFERMRADAVPLGEQIVAGERELDRLFADGQATSAEVARLTAGIARLQGRLRATHLVAHVEAKALLTPDQVARYDGLRGYGSAAGAK